MLRYKLFCSIAILLTACSSLRPRYIIYDLPPAVSNRVTEYLKNNQADPKESKFIGQLSKLDDEKYILFVIHYDFAGLKNYMSIEEGLVKKTTRMIRVNEILLPLITDEDLLFADLGSVKMKDGRIAKKKVIFNSEAYAIYFDKYGNLYER